jgi:hypothetical protein
LSAADAGVWGHSLALFCGQHNQDNTVHSYLRYALLMLVSLCLMSFGSSRLVAQSSDVKVTATVGAAPNQQTEAATFVGSGNPQADQGTFTGPGTTSGDSWRWKKEGNDFKVYKNGVLWWVYSGVGNSANTSGVIEQAGGVGGGWTR